MGTYDDPPAFAFAPLRPHDLPLLVSWLNAPHVRRWFGGGASAEKVAAEYGPMARGEVPITAYIVQLDGRPVGMIDWMRFGDLPELQRLYEVDDPDVANCDMLIGEPTAVHRGLGAPLVREFLAQVVFADPRISACVLDPVPDNAVAIRAYEKAGFRFLRALPDDGEGNGLYLMELGRSELGQPARGAEPYYLRPARPEEAALAQELDDDACTLYSEAGLGIDESREPDFFAHEASLWSQAARDGRLILACAADGTPVGFASLGLVDGEPHLQQLSVQRAWMRRGIGRTLLNRAQRWSVRPGALWLTTWDHVPWNRPFYESHGFTCIPEADCGPELREILAAERRALPAPEHRIAMRYQHPRRG